MKIFFQNTFIQSMLVFFALIGVVAVYQTISYYQSEAVLEMDSEMTTEIDTDGDVMAHESMGMPAMDMDDMDEMVVETIGESDPYAGTHIMPNGMVMTGSGEMVPDAIMLENGDIEMPDGTMVTPVGDFR